MSTPLLTYIPSLGLASKLHLSKTKTIHVAGDRYMNMQNGTTHLVWVAFVTLPSGFFLTRCLRVGTALLPSQSARL